MELQIDTSEPLAIATLTGPLDFEGARNLVDSLRDHASGEGAALALDLSGVDWIDSSGLSALVELVTRARLSDARVLLAAPSSFVSGIFRTTRLDQWFEICDSIQEAQRRFERR